MHSPDAVGSLANISSFLEIKNWTTEGQRGEIVSFARVLFPEDSAASFSALARVSFWEEEKLGPTLTESPLRGTQMQSSWPQNAHALPMISQRTSKDWSNNTNHPGLVVGVVDMSGQIKFNVCAVWKWTVRAAQIPPLDSSAERNNEPERNCLTQHPSRSVNPAGAGIFGGKPNRPEPDKQEWLFDGSNACVRA